MTAGEAATFFANLPPDTPVVIRPSVTGQDFVPVHVEPTLMRKTVYGTYCRFMADKLQHRNDTPVIVIS